MILDLNEIKGDDNDNDASASPYHPKPGRQDGSFADSQGTTLILRRFGYKRVPQKEDLNRQLAARFGLSRDDWKVFLTDNSGESEPVELGSLKIDILPDTRIEVEDRPVPVGDREFPCPGGWHTQRTRIETKSWLVSAYMQGENSRPN